MLAATRGVVAHRYRCGRAACAACTQPQRGPSFGAVASPGAVRSQLRPPRLTDGDPFPSLPPFFPEQPAPLTRSPLSPWLLVISGKRKKRKFCAAQKLFGEFQTARTARISKQGPHCFTTRFAPTRLSLHSRSADATHSLHTAPLCPTPSPLEVAREDRRTTQAWRTHLSTFFTF